jgi:hypothetical protein
MRNTPTIGKGTLTEAIQGIQYLFSIQIMELNKSWNVIGRLGIIILDPLLDRQRLEKTASYKAISFRIQRKEKNEPTSSTFHAT